MYNLVSFSGIFVLMAIAWLFSADRKLINWRVIIWGTVLQHDLCSFHLRHARGLTGLSLNQ